jgi:hypothetical protein
MLHKERGRCAENPLQSDKICYDSHDCKSNSKCILQEGWLASLEDFAVSLAGLFQHICLLYRNDFCSV